MLPWTTFGMLAKQNLRFYEYEFHFNCIYDRDTLHTLATVKF